MIHNDDLNDQLGDDHIATNAETPLRPDAFELSDDEKINAIKKDVENILNTFRTGPYRRQLKRHTKPSSQNVCKRNFRWFAS